MAFGYYYPDVDTSGVIFVPERGPLVGSQPMGNTFPGIQQRLATGRKITYRGVGVGPRRWRFLYRAMSEEEVEARRAFSVQIPGATFELAWPDTGTLYQVVLLESSLSFDPTETEYGFEWEDMLEEQPA